MPWLCALLSEVPRDGLYGEPVKVVGRMPRERPEKLPRISLSRLTRSRLGE